VFDRWLVNSIMAGKLPFSITDIPFISRPHWLLRGWDWVDPLKDTMASVQAIEQGLSTRTRENAKKGEDYEEIIRERAREEDFAKEQGVAFGDPIELVEAAAALNQGEGNENNQT
jgi:capsid protein